jgi:tetratricopeptide (TPR) repeat protein
MQSPEEPRQTIDEAKLCCDQEPKKALHLLERLKHHSLNTLEQADMLYAQGVATYRLNEFQKSEQLLLQAKRLYEEAGNREGIALTQNAIGNVCLAVGRYTEASDNFHQSLAYWKETNNMAMLATLLSNLGNLCYNLSDYPQALAYHQEALRIREKLGEPQKVASSLNNLGVVYADLAEYELAKESFEKCLKLKETFASPSSIANTCINLANALRNLGERDEAKRVYELAKSRYEADDNEAGKGIALHGLGKVYYEENRCAEAKACLSKAIIIFEKLGMKRELMLGLLVMGRVISKLEQVD